MNNASLTRLVRSAFKKWPDTYTNTPVAYYNHNGDAEASMINESKVKNFVFIINSLVDSETQPLRSDAWLLPTLQDRRRAVWKEMNDEERQLARTMLGERAKWC